MQSIIQCEICDPSESRLITDLESGEIICNICGIVIVKIWKILRRYGNEPKIILMIQGMVILLL